jgi:hypothetical protein
MGLLQGNPTLELIAYVIHFLNPNHFTHSSTSVAIGYREVMAFSINMSIGLFFRPKFCLPLGMR